jgi:lipopolysaccharide transport system ATP-binding protein
MSSVVEIVNIGKAYRNYGSETRRLLSWFGIFNGPVEQQWTVRNISFSIAPGEVVGIVGQNGAGKSTLLKMITGTVRPTEGRVVHHGRIAAILELGMGFHPDLTGRQNAYHSSGLMGHAREHTDRIIDWIESFSEIGEYFDRPVRTYSSGMQMRVAFAVATAYRPDLLIVDEALSVGDAYFQHKSFDRIREICDQGTSLLLVSHDRSAIQAVCGRALLLEKGSIIKDGSPEEVMDYYNAIIADRQNSKLEETKLEDGKIRVSSGSGEAKISSLQLLDKNKNPTDLIGVGDSVTLRAKVSVFKNISSLVLGYGIKDRLGQIIYGTNTWHSAQVIKNARCGDEFEFSIDFPANFGVGSYSIHTALHDAENHLSANYEWRELALVFNVVNRDKAIFVGCLWNEPIITIKKCT